jgi:hypothetical protein
MRRGAKKMGEGSISEIAFQDRAPYNSIRNLQPFSLDILNLKYYPKKISRCFCINISIFNLNLI